MTDISHALILGMQDRSCMMLSTQLFLQPQHVPDRKQSISKLQM